MAVALDRLDLKILTILQDDGRITNRRLAEEVGLSQSACLDRVRRLTSHGVIRQFKAVLSLQILGNWITVYAQISLAELGGHRQKHFEDWVMRCPQIVDCVEISGASDYLARFVCENIQAYQALTDQMLKDEDLQVKDINSHIVMRDIKSDAGLPVMEHLGAHAL